MLAVDLHALVGKMNDVCRQALDAALGLTVSRTHYNAEIEHWLLKLLDANDSDVIHILDHFELDRGLVAAELNKVLDRLKRGNARAPELSPQLVTLAREAWLIASLEGRAGRIRSGHLIAALLADDALALQIRRSSGELARVPADQLRREFVKICGSSAEAAAAAVAPVADSAPAAPGSGGSQTPALDQFTIDLTAQARAGRIDPILGRDSEIRQLIDILSRRRQNNPILTGEPGVGKTAVVEGFALKVAQKDVPESLLGVAVRTLDLGLLQAGAGVKGEFENRLKQVIDEVRASVQPIILFIDEAHTLIGAGGQAGQNDAANLLKPALARGDLRTIAATTWAEYKKYFERDAALTRRFQVVKVEEPSEPTAVAMVRGLVDTLEKHHKVRILDEALVEAVRLSHRYIAARQLPDKAVSLLDTACARVAMSQTSIPAAIEDLRRSIELDGSTLDILRREMITGAPHEDTVAELEQRRAEAGDKLATLEQRWEAEMGLVGQIQALRSSLESPSGEGGEASAGQIAGWKEGLADKTRELKSLQGEAPLLQPVVDGQAVAEVVAAWTGIPVGRMVSDEIRTVLTLEDKLRERIIGQDQALTAIAEAVKTSRAKLADARKPIGVFLMVGTSGVGKTETALALSELLYGGEQNLTVINMSEFKEEHKISMLLGSPPGYVGYGEGGVLTEAVRRRPYGVVLLDEMEKAHPGIQDVFYQVFDKGMLRDGEGRDIDFKNTIVIMTSNAGTDLIASLCADPETRPDSAGLAEALRPELLKTFKPAFLGRTTLVPYFPLSEGIIRQIVALQLRRIQKRVTENYKAQFGWDPALVEGIARRCTESESGARNIERILAQGLLPELSALLLERMADGQSIGSIRVSQGEESRFQYQIA